MRRAALNCARSGIRRGRLALASREGGLAGHASRSARTSSVGQDGFTIVEVLVAATVLVVGVGATLALVVAAAGTAAQTKGVEGATNVAREITESARKVPFSQLTSDQVVPALQAVAGLESTTAGSWRVTRRGISYAVDVEVCSIDDAKDGYGAHDPDYCPQSATAGTDDGQPLDFKRLTATISWQPAAGAKTRSVRQLSYIAASGADTPGVSALVLTSPAVATPSAPVIATAVASATFKVTAPGSTARVTYSVGGVDKGSASPTGNGSDWTFTLPIAAWKDGVYEVGARAYDATGAAGPTYTIPLTLNRQKPDPPAGLKGGRNRVYISGQSTTVDVAELEWLASSEGNVVGYRAYRPDGSLACPPSLQDPPPTATSCIDFSPQDGTYKVVAVYKDATGALRESNPATVSSSLPERRFYFTATSLGNGTSGCPKADFNYEMNEGYAGQANPLTGPTRSTEDTIRFCSPPAAASDRFPSGTSRVYAYMTNSGSQPCTVIFTLETRGSPGPWASVTVPAATSTVTPYTVSLASPEISLAVGDRIGVLMNASGSACDPLRLTFAGTANRSRLEMPAKTYSQPNPPQGLAASSTADGAKLTWQAPSSGPAPDFYRVYRDGYAYANRYDRTGGPELTYTDPDRVAGTHAYYVTAVSGMTESTPTGPVSP